MADNKLDRLSHQTFRDAIMNETAGKAGIAVGTNAGTLKIGNQFDYSIGGVYYRKAATDNIAITAAAQQPINTTTWYVFSIDASGNVTTTKGTDGVTATLPTVPAGLQAFGLAKITTNGSTTFTAGTTALNAAGITATLYDVMHAIPDVSAL